MKQIYLKPIYCTVIWDTFLIITILMGAGWPMFSENTLMLYHQDLELGPYFVKWQLVIDQGLPRLPITYFAK